MTGINLFVAKAPAAEAAGPVSSSGTYTNGLFSVTSSMTPISLPAGGGTVKLTYTLTNTGSEALWYTTDNNNVCATQVIGFTASVYSPGEYFLMPGETASFSCSGKVTHQDKANAHVPGPNSEPLVSTGAQGFVPGHRRFCRAKATKRDGLGRQASCTSTHPPDTFISARENRDSG